MKNNLYEEKQLHEDIKYSDKVIARDLNEIDNVLLELKNIKEKGPISNLPDYDVITKVINTCNILDEIGNVDDIKVIDLYEEYQKEQYAKKKEKLQSNTKFVGKIRMSATTAACFAATAVISISVVLAKSQSNDVNSTFTTTKTNIKSMASTTINEIANNDNLSGDDIKSNDIVATDRIINDANTTKIESTENESSLLFCDRLKLKDVTLTNDPIDTNSVKKTKKLKYDCYKIEKISIIRCREELAEIEVTSDMSSISIEKFINDCKNVYGNDIDIKMGVSGMIKNRVVKKNVGWISLNDIKTPKKLKEDKKSSEEQYIKVSKK